MNVFRRAYGRFHLLFGFCPACNSDAPAKDTCKVCDGYGWPSQYPPLPETKKLWWARFTEKDP